VQDEAVQRKRDLDGATETQQCRDAPGDEKDRTRRDEPARPPQDQWR